MRKTMMKFISLMLIIVLLFSFLSVESFAEENVTRSVTQYGSVAHHYFDSRRHNIPENLHGTCAYIAMSMILSFYDVYWNDSIVNDQHEEEYQITSTINNDYPESVPYFNLENGELTELEEDSKAAYINFVQVNSPTYLHMYLISLGIELGLYAGDEESDSLGINLEQAAAVLDKYFDEVIGPDDYYRSDENYNSNTPFTIHIRDELDSGVDRQNVLEKIKEQLEKGNPVIYKGFRIKTENQADEDEYRCAYPYGNSNSKNASYEFDWNP